MPVRFLGGGGGGGGSTDVRTIIAAPTMTATSATTETTTCVWTIPANYLLAKDAIYINLMGTTALSAQANKPIYRIRIGSTGTISDSLLFSTILEGTVYPAVAATVAIEQLIYFNSIGSSGDCVSNGRVDNYNSGNSYTSSNIPAQKTTTTINTTATLYISVSVFFASAGNTFTPEVPFISFSL